MGEELQSIMSFEIAYSSSKVNHCARIAEEKKTLQRKRNILHLIHQHLKDEGLQCSAQSLSKEACLTGEYEVCDNIDLPTIVMEYETYYYLRFQKYPKICKKAVENIESTNFSVPKSKNNFQKKKTVQANSSSSTLNNESNSFEQKEGGKNDCKPDKSVDAEQLSKDLQSEIKVIPLLVADNSKTEENNSIRSTLLQPPPHFSGEYKDLAEIIIQDIWMMNLNVHWDDVKGLNKAKSLLKEAVVYPVKYPELFSGILSPWKGLLLYGPPGTGKTLLAKAVAAQCKTTFFNISACSLVSKWRGDSEKLVRVLFDLARHYAPSTIFLDEIDALASHRDGLLEHEASRRLKAELLIQMDGISSSHDSVFLLATSNLPWALDAAILRRLPKRILVDLPDTEARKAMFQHYLPPTILNKPLLQSDLNYSKLAEVTDGYSGSDIKLVSQETLMNAIRPLFSVLEECESGTNLCKLKAKVISTDDVMHALTKTRPSASHLVSKYQKWQEDFGSA
ncbi:katanin p60 ATPase-containing subunit A-like 2 isoform X1 [Schistocerca americana]|uniref:katanin p60 ATPase-containing subunit A-like 2 isoform X1 n=2 Tax=Schistocerca americana TaxID=7009 RepID=UPI001F4FEB23|nr:katanin p60 ATPase-containing subunit A-like 2 isoform X1 [Schistocerca americana]